MWVSWLPIGILSGFRYVIQRMITANRTSAESIAGSQIGILRGLHGCLVSVVEHS
jgi:hypothetical protein